MRNQYKLCDLVNVLPLEHQRRACHAGVIDMPTVLLPTLERFGATTDFFIINSKQDLVQRLFFDLTAVDYGIDISRKHVRCSSHRPGPSGQPSHDDIPQLSTAPVFLPAPFIPSTVHSRLDDAHARRARISLGGDAALDEAVRGGGAHAAHYARQW